MSSSDHNWLTNKSQGSPLYGKQYYRQVGFDDDNNPGTWHMYQDGSKEFVRDTFLGNAQTTIIYPAQSSYQGLQAAVAPPPDDALQKMKGWATGQVAEDPTKGVIGATASVSTDPTKIHDQNQKNPQQS